MEFTNSSENKQLQLKTAPSGRTGEIQTRQGMTSMLERAAPPDFLKGSLQRQKPPKYKGFNEAVGP